MPTPRSAARSRTAAWLAVSAGLALLAFPSVASAAVVAEVDAGVLTVTTTGTAADGIAITCVGGQVKVNGADPAPASTCASITAIDVTGNPGTNVITLVGVTVVSTGAVFPNVTEVDVDGGAGDDTITGSDIDDNLLGGEDDDRIIGDNNPAGTRDIAAGGSGRDTLVWNPGDGDDINEGGTETDTIEVNGGGGGEQFTVAPSATAGRIAFDRTGPTPPGPFNLDIGTAERLDLNAGGGDDRMDSTTGDGFALDIDGGADNDTLDGGDGADLITGGAGNDRISGDDNPALTRDNSVGGDGDDTLVWNPGDDDDTNEGGAGTDTIEVNGGGDEQFTVAPSATPNRISFDRVSPAPFNVDIGSAERLDLNAAAGVDNLTSSTGVGFALDVDGGDGDDTLDGGEDADLITGGAGNDRISGSGNPAGTRDTSVGGDGDDTLVWNPGDDDDTNEGGAGTDTIEVNGGGVAERFTVKPSPTAGRVLFDRTGPTPPGPFNLDIGTSERLVLNAGAGNDSITGANGLAGLIASTFNGDDGNDRITGTDGADQLFGGNGNDVIRSRDQRADRVSCGAGFDLARVDGRDLVSGCNIVIGGRQRVRLLGRTANVVLGRAVLRLRCVATLRCSGTVRLLRGSTSLGTARFNATRRRAKTVRVRLNATGRRVVARAPRRGVRIQVQINARDGAGNGWRTTTTIRLRR